MRIIYEDDELLVCYKEAGLATQSANIRSADLVSEIKTYLSNNNATVGEPYVGIVHRLDQPVSGLLVVAKTESSAIALSKQVQTEQMNKVYSATVEGLLPISDTPVILTDYLCRDGKQNKAIVASKGQKGPDGKIAKEAVLSYVVLSVDPQNNTSTLQVTLRTGRFHQIRAQLSHQGHPIVGDNKYGSHMPIPNHQKGILLCADILSFIHPKTAKPMQFQLD